MADTPGHEQYTRNMATGASTADVAVLLVDARKGLLKQTRRHSLVVSTLGTRHVILAVNKMDLVGWSEEVFDAIVAEYRAFARDLGFLDVAGIPMAAKLGDNVTRASAETPWYEGPDLLTKLETLDIASGDASTGFRLPVQWVNRPHSEFRGFAGTVVGGPVRPGDRVVVLPSGQTTEIARIVTFDGDLPEAQPGQAITLTLADEVDASRGAVIAQVSAPSAVASGIEARVFWMGKSPIRAGAAYLAKIGAQTVPATVEQVTSRLDLQSADPASVDALEVNDLGDVRLSFDRLVVVDDYARSRETGSLILIDRETFDTVGMGLVLAPAAEALSSGMDESRVSPAAWSPAIAYWLPAPFAAPWRSALKTASWRLAGTALTVSGALWLTADLRIALLLGLFELVVKFALQFGHERLWTRIGVGLRPSPAANHSSAT